MKSPILTAYDFGPASEGALAWSAELSKALGVPLSVLHVLVPTNADIVPALLLSGYPTQGDVDATAATIARAATRHGCAATPVVTVSPHVGAAIIERAQAMGAGLIVMGTHGHNALVRAMLGSVASYVIQHADCPVVIMRDTASHQRLVPGERRRASEAPPAESAEASGG